MALQTTTPKIPLMRLRILDHEPKIRCCTMSLNYDLWWDYIAMSFGPWVSASFCKYGLFWALKEIFPKSMIVLTWCELPMKWSHVVWKICPQQRDISVKEQMALVLRYVNKKGIIIKRFLDIVHVASTTTLSLKYAIECLLCEHNLSLSKLHG